MAEETDGIEEAFEGQLRVLVTAAGQVGERIARGREEALRRAQAQSEQEARELQSRLAAEQRAARAELANVHRSDWWDRATPEVIGRTYQVARAWSQEDPEAVRAEQRMNDELRTRYGVDVNSTNADPAAVVFDALNAAEARGADVVIVDTAGRLHTKTNLMDELGKVARVIRRKTGRDPETLLVVDGNTGQNGLSQAKVFAETIPVQGLILTKLDGTAKGGIVVAIAESLGLPVRWVGMGEKVEDLAAFDADLFVDALFADWRAGDDAGDD